MQIILAKELKSIQELNWAADGNRLYVAKAIHGKSGLDYVDLKGNARPLWVNHGGNWAIGVHRQGVTIWRS
jgi:hypothetical protein